MLNINDAIASFGNMTLATVAEESMILEYKQAVERKNKLGQVTSYAVKGDATLESISINWCQDNDGSQCLHLKKKTELLASFNLRSNGTIEWLPNTTFNVRSTLIAKPIDPEQDTIVSFSLYNFFDQWIKSKPFSVGLNQLAQEMIYPPAVVKLLLLFISYMTERTRQAELTGKLSQEANLTIDMDRVSVMYHDLLRRLVGDKKRMQRLYAGASDFIALPANRDEILALVAEEVDQPEPIAEEKTIDPDNTEDDQDIMSLPSEPPDDKKFEADFKELVESSEPIEVTVNPDTEETQPE